MKKNSADLKQIARGNLKGHYGLTMGAMIVANLIITAINLPFSFTLTIGSSYLHLVIYYLVSFITGLLSSVLSAGLTHIHLRLSRNESPDFSDLFYGFQIRPDRFLLAYLLLSLISVIWVIPGSICIIAAALSESILLLIAGGLLLLCALAVLLFIGLKFALIFILLTDHPSMGVLESFRESSRIMDGNKGRLFYINLSFLGWILLGILSCSIGFLWLIPYFEQTFVCFYRDVTGDWDSPPPPGNS